MCRRGDLDSELHRLFVWQRRYFQLHMLSSLSAIRLKREIPVNDHADRKSRPDRQCRLDVHLLTHELLTGLAHGIAEALPQGLDDRSVVGIRIGTGIYLAADREQR